MDGYLILSLRKNIHHPIVCGFVSGRQDPEYGQIGRVADTVRCLGIGLYWYGAVFFFSLRSSNPRRIDSPRNASRPRPESHPPPGHRSSTPGMASPRLFRSVRRIARAINVRLARGRSVHRDAVGRSFGSYFSKDDEETRSTPIRAGHPLLSLEARTPPRGEDRRPLVARGSKEQGGWTAPSLLLYSSLLYTLTSQLATRKSTRGGEGDDRRKSSRRNVGKKK